MGQRTGIQWCDDTVNPTTGCDGCELWKWIESIGRAAGPCYAGNLHEGRLAKAMPGRYAPEFTTVRTVAGRMRKAAAAADLAGTARPGKPWLDGLPRVIFVGDMGDIMSKDVPREYLMDEVFAAITSESGRRHIWMLLTKQPRRLADFARWWQKSVEFWGGTFEWPENVICGTSVTTQATVSRVDDLVRLPGRLFVSAEPLWEAVDLSRHINSLDLVIAGGQSGDDPRPFDLDWARKLRDECRGTGASFFVKQLGAYPIDRLRLFLRDSHGGDWDEWPDDLRVREFPRPK